VALSGALNCEPIKPSSHRAALADERASTPARDGYFLRTPRSPCIPHRLAKRGRALCGANPKPAEPISTTDRNLLAAGHTNDWG
jgi:hypothetical protein